MSTTTEAMKEQYPWWPAALQYRSPFRMETDELELLLKAMVRDPLPLLPKLEDQLSKAQLFTDPISRLTAISLLRAGEQGAAAEAMAGMIHEPTPGDSLLDTSISLKASALFSACAGSGAACPVILANGLPCLGQQATAQQVLTCWNARLGEGKKKKRMAGITITSVKVQLERFYNLVQDKGGWVQVGSVLF